MSVKNEEEAIGQEFKPCSVKMLPEALWIKAAAHAVDINPINAPAVHQLKRGMQGLVLPPLHLALLTQKYWGREGVNLTVGFLDNPPAELLTTILAHMNSWGKFSNVNFLYTNTDPQVRISRERGDGYWSYLGTDILQIDADKPTMNLDSFTMRTPISEFYRVVRHETGHTLGFPHEHTRKEIVNKIDKEKAIAYFMRTQRWSREDVIKQVLTPLEDAEIIASTSGDENSIMCYWLPGEIMADGQPVPGGSDITPTDADFASVVYPKPRIADSHPEGMSKARVTALRQFSAAANNPEPEIEEAVNAVLSRVTGMAAGQINNKDSLSDDLRLTTPEIRSLATPFKQIARNYKSGVMITPDECEELDTVQDCIDLIVKKIS